MRIIVALIAGLASCLPALADTPAGQPETVEQPETIMVKDLFSESGLKEVKPDWEEINKHPLGSEGNPVRCDMPAGERTYLARLRCPGGTSPAFERQGSTGIGPYGAIMDVYQVSCPPSDGMEPKAVYMDMYHPQYQEKRPVPGFSIVPPLDSVHPKAE